MARLKKMELRTRGLSIIIVIYCLLSLANGQPFPVFAQDQGNPQQPNIPAQQQTSRQQATTQLSQQFLQNNQPPGGGTADILAGSNTRTQQVRTVTVPVLPAPAGLTAQLGQQLQPQDVGPIPRFAPQNGPIGRQFTRFGPGQLGAMAAARRRQMAMMQQQVAQQANMVQPGRRFQGLALPSQVLAQQRAAGFSQQAQQARGNTFSPVRPSQILAQQQAAQQQAARQQAAQQQAAQQFQAQTGGNSVSAVSQNQPPIQQQQQFRFPQALPPQQTMRSRTQGSSNVIPGQQTGATMQFQTQQFNNLPQGQPTALLRQQQTGASLQQFQAQQARASAFSEGQQNALQNQQQTGAPQQQLQAQQANAVNGGFGQQAGAQNQQGQAGPLWRPDVRMPGMIGPPAGAFPPRAFPGMFPPGRVTASRAQNRIGARQTAQTRFTGNDNTLTQTSQTGTPVINPRDPRVGMMPAVASLAGFGSRQRPFPMPTNGVTNRVNTATQTIQQTVANRGPATFPANQPMFPGAFPGRIPTGLQGMQRTQMVAMAEANRRAQQANIAAQMARTQNGANIRVPIASGRGQASLNAMGGAFPGGPVRVQGQTGANTVVPPAVGAFPGTASATGNVAQPSNVAAFPGSETSAVDTSVATNELPSNVAAFPGAEPVPEINLPDAVPGFPGTEPVGFDSTSVTGFPGAEPELPPGELPPPPPVFPANDISNIPKSADADLFPPVDFGFDTSSTSNTASSSSTSSKTSSPKTSTMSFGIPRPVGGSSTSTVDVSVVESAGTSSANQQAFPGGINNAPTKEGEMAVAGSTNTNVFPGAFPNGEAAAFPNGGPASSMSAFPGGQSSRFPSGEADANMAAFPGVDSPSSATAFQNTNTGPMFQGSDMSVFPSSNLGPAPAFPSGQSASGTSTRVVSETSSNMAGFPGTDPSDMTAFPSFPSISGPPDAPAFQGAESPSNSASTSKITTKTVTTSKKVSVLPVEETRSSVSSFPVGGTSQGTGSGVPVGVFPGGSNVAPGISGVPIHLWDPSSASNI